MYKFSALEIPYNNKYLAPATRKSGKELQSRVDILVSRQDELSAKDDAANNLPLTEIADWQSLSRMYHSLLCEEMTIRNEYAEWLAHEKMDRENRRMNASRQYDKLKKQLCEDLVKLGFNENDMPVMACVNRHPVIVELYQEANPFSDTPYIEQNNSAIDYVQNELEKMRKQKIA